MHLLKSLVVFFLFGFLFSCGIFDSTNSENLVAFQATNNLGRQIYTVNFGSPKISLHQITNNDHQNIEPLFSYGKKYLLYSELQNAISNNNAQWIYDFDRKTSNLLEVIDFQYPIVYAKKKIWHPSNDKIYLGLIPGPWSAYDIYEYTFNTKIMKSLTHDWQEVYKPLGFLHPDTMIIYFGDNNENPGRYKMDLYGNIYDKINNPYFERKIVGGVVKSGPRTYHYSMVLETFLIAMITEEAEGCKIIATNLDGSYYEEFTNGDYDDDYPVFGPDNDYIIFERKPVNDHRRENSSIVYMPVAGGPVKVLVDENTFSNLSGFSHPVF